MRSPRLDAHIVALCEVNNHHGVTSERLVEALKRRGQTWYGASGGCTGVQGTDVCVLSKYPIEEVVTGLSTVPGGVDMKVRIDVGGRDVLLYPAHLDYTHYACYLPRGYDGVTWKKLPAPDGNPESVLRMNRASTRDEAVAAFLEEVSREQADPDPAGRGFQRAVALGLDRRDVRNVGSQRLHSSLGLLRAAL